MRRLTLWFLVMLNLLTLFICCQAPFLVAQHAMVKISTTKKRSGRLLPPPLSVSQVLAAAEQMLLTDYSLPGFSTSHLELISVKEPTIHDYIIRAKEFAIWCAEMGLHWVSDPELDLSLLLFFDMLFFKGKGVDAGSKLVAALKYMMPRFARVGAGTLPRTARALTSWGKARPGNQRLPFPLIALMAVIGVLTFQGKTWEALYLFVQFRTYIRPGAFAKLRVKQLIPPALAAGLVCSHWCLNLNPVEDLVPGKTGLFDESIMWDLDLWAGAMFTRLIHGRCPEDPLWPLDHGHMILLFKNACSQLGMACLEPCLYSLRHGGASQDLLSRTRTLEEVKKRGGWRSDASLRRYGKDAKLTAELNKIPQTVRDYGVKIGSHLEAVLCHNVLFEPPSLPHLTA